jgi:spore coat polysaccharide biosynthesis protein SpsF
MSAQLRSVSRESIVVLQARMGSSRLPGKVLAPISGRTILSHCIRRLQAAAIGEVVVATSTRPEDMAVVVEAQRHNVRVVRGSATDVLGRFLLAIEDWQGPFVFRATADNPVVDIDAPGRVLKVLEGGADYCVEEGLPVGAAVEGMRTSALRESATLAQSPYDREHVTPYLRHQPGRFAVRPVAAPPECYRPHLRLTVDTRDDLSYVRSLLEQAGADARLVPLKEVIALADRYASWSGVA